MTGWIAKRGVICVICLAVPQTASAQDPNKILKLLQSGQIDSARREAEKLAAQTVGKPLARKPQQPENAGATTKPAGTGDVKLVQKYLDELGFDPGPVDGQWGRRSQTALAAFRQSIGSLQNSRPQPADLAAMERALTASRNAAFSKDAPDAAPRSVGFWALPMVDTLRRFRVAWITENGQQQALAIVPQNGDQGAAIDPPTFAASPAPLFSPAQPGTYDLILFEPATGIILARHALEVR